MKKLLYILLITLFFPMLMPSKATLKAMIVIDQVNAILDAADPAQVGGAASAWLSWLDIVESGSALVDAANALDNNECIPDLTTPTEAMLPSGCLDSPACTECYEDSVRRLDVVRRGLARMSCIYMNTKRFTDAALSFGDNVSGIHGASGLVWQGQRRGIEASWSNFEKSYDKKYTDFILSLDEALKGISTCETQYGMRDWYQRFGILYLEMMKLKYKRGI